VLTGVRNERGESCRGSGGEDRRRGRYGLVEEAKQRVLGRPRLHGSMRGVPAEMLQGSVRPVVRRRLGFERRRVLPAAALVENSARAGWRTRQHPRGKLLAARRSSCGARRGWGGGEAAWPRRRGALRRAEVAGLALGCRGGGCVARIGLKGGAGAN